MIGLPFYILTDVKSKAVEIKVAFDPLSVNKPQQFLYGTVAVQGWDYRTGVGVTAGAEFNQWSVSIGSILTAGVLDWRSVDPRKLIGAVSSSDKTFLYNGGIPAGNLAQLTFEKAWHTSISGDMFVTFKQSSTQAFHAVLVVGSLFLFDDDDDDNDPVWTEPFQP
jgi:hypothetical protein